ncbi:hypothetical protein UFOVP61_49 [uncultured Caudovirales phage]|uniref:DUF2833 domain-containing protein n=1 Tax=uncultured Caudovirales phage TaxID=2100421 RepID=A0A6J5KVM5_9CAUD|nr:hypothetical protein UFOVP61_49 [uncultured Caudovirales phage]
MVEARAVEPGDIVELVVKMRQADIDELEAVGVQDFVKEIRSSVERSAFSYTFWVDGGLACIIGVVPAGGLFDPHGIPWMLGTDLVTVNQRALMRTCRPYIRQMLQAYPVLFNFVHADNHRAVRWLKCVGFTLQPAQPFGPLGAPFHRFDMKA